MARNIRCLRTLAGNTLSVFHKKRKYWPAWTMKKRSSAADDFIAIFISRRRIGLFSDFSRRNVIRKYSRYSTTASDGVWRRGEIPGHESRPLHSEAYLDLWIGKSCAGPVDFS